MKRSIQACQALGIPVKEHFKKVYTCSSSQTVRDWRLSALARKWVILNADPSNPLVAKFQLGLLE